MVQIINVPPSYVDDQEYQNRQYNSIQLTNKQTYYDLRMKQELILFKTQTKSMFFGGKS